MTQPTHSSVNTSVSIALLRLSSGCLHWFSLRTKKKRGALSCCYGRRQPPDHRSGRSQAAFVHTRETCSRHHHRHASARHTAASDRTHLWPSTRGWTRVQPTSGRLVRLVNSRSLEHQKGEIASVIIHERRAVKNLATSKKHSSWSPICEWQMNISEQVRWCRHTRCSVLIRPSYRPHIASGLPAGGN